MSKGQKYCLSFIVLTCFSIRAVFFNHQSLWPDEALYLYISQNLTLNLLDLRDIYGNLFYKNPPLFMYLLSLLSKMDVFEPRLIAHFLTTLMDTGTVIITFLIAKELYGIPVGLIAAGLLSVNPLHWFISTRILPDVPLTFFIYLALFALIKRKALTFYVFSILGFATKYTAAPLFLLPLINNYRIKKRPLVWLSIYLLAVLATVLMISHAVKTEYEWFNYFIRFFKIPDFQELYREARYYLNMVLCFFFLLGLAITLKKKDFSPLLNWVIVFGTARLFLPWMAFRLSRYTLPLYPAIMVFAAYGGIASFHFLEKKLPDRKLFLSLVFSSILLYVVSVSALRGYNSTHLTNRNSIGFEQIRIFFDERPTDNVAVLTSSPNQVKYLVPDLTVFDLAADSTPERAYRLIQGKDIKYVIVDRWSPHQPTWVPDYFLPDNGYHPVFGTRHLLILEVGKNPN
jgi:4-amino-4-deoxy-L-arabinose transferase-like glycosyltransferase